MVKRLLAGVLAGMLAAGSVHGGFITAYATDGEDFTLMAEPDVAQEQEADGEKAPENPDAEEADPEVYFDDVNIADEPEEEGDTEVTEEQFYDELFTVTFDANEGSFGENESGVYKFVPGDIISQIPEEPVRDGYSFFGWFSDADASLEADPIGMPVTSDLTFYAGWAEDEETETEAELLADPEVTTLTLDFNGGTWTKEWPRPQKTYESYELEKWDEYLVSYTPEREGYIFDGWYADKECTVLLSESDYSQVLREIPEPGAIYAGWTNDIVTITLDYNQEGVENVQVLVGKKYPGAFYDLEDLFGYYGKIQGFEFDYWSEDIAGTKRISTSRYIFTEDTTIYAQYIRLYDVSYHALGGVIPAREYDYDFTYSDDGRTAVKAAVEGSRLSGYAYSTDVDGTVSDAEYTDIPQEPYYDDEDSDMVFEGWYTDQDLTNRVTMEQIARTVVNSDIDFYAGYVKGYSLTFDAGEGTVMGNKKLVYRKLVPRSCLSQNKQFNKEINMYEPCVIPVPDELEDAGKTFAGWSLNPDNGDILENYDIENLVLTENTVLYAVYSDICTVTFHSEKGTMAGAVSGEEDVVTVSVPKGTAVGAKAPVVKKEGSTFGGWFITDDRTGDPINIYNYPVEKDTELYANFNADGYYTITFKSGKEGALFVNGKDTVTVRVKKGEPLYYSDKGNPKVNTSPKIQYTKDLKDKEVVPTGVWTDGQGTEYYFSSPGGLISVDPYFRADGVTAAIPDSGFIPVSDITLTAVWKKAVTITFDAGIDGRIYERFNTSEGEVKISEDPYLSFPRIEEIYSILEYTTYEGVKYSDFKDCIPDVMDRDYNASYSIWIWGYTDPDCATPVEDGTTFDSDTPIYVKKTPDTPGISHYIRLKYGDGLVYDHVIPNSISVISVPEWNSSSFYNYDMPTINDPSKAFAGWYKDAELTQAYNFVKYQNGKEYLYFPAEITDLYAKYVDGYKVTLDANGGYFDDVDGVLTPDVSADMRSRRRVSAMAAPGREVNLSVFESRLRNDTDAVFNGWFTDKECKNRADITSVDSSGSEFYKPEESTTLYAGWRSYATPEKIAIDADSKSLELGQTTAITVDGAPEGARISWRFESVAPGSSNVTGIVPIVIGTDGTVTGKAEGTASVYAEVNGFRSNTITFTVEASAEGAEVTLEPESLELWVQDEVTVTAQVEPQILEDMPFDWSSTSDAVALVSGNGRNATITAVGEGSATITVKVGGATASMTVKVTDSIVTDKSKVSLTDIEGASQLLKVTLKGYEKDTAPSLQVNFDGAENPDFVKVSLNSLTYGDDGTGTADIEIEPGGEHILGTGQLIVSATGKEGKTYSKSVDVTVSDIQQATPVTINPDYDIVSNTVTNGNRIYLTTKTRGASIVYGIMHQNEPFGELSAEEAGAVKESLVDTTVSSSFRKVYSQPITVNSGEPLEYLRVFAIAVKEGLKASELTWMDLTLDNSDAWMDVIEEDRETLFGNNMENVAGSGLLIAPLPSALYTGEKITFTGDELRVYFNGKRLTAGKDYKVSYANNVNAFEFDKEFRDMSDAEKAKTKAPRATITATGSYSGKWTEFFEIEKRSVLDTYIASAEEVTALFSDKKIAPVPTLKLDMPSGKAKALKAGTDFEVFYNRIDEAETPDFTTKLSADDIKADIAADKYGKYLINLAGKGNFTGELSDKDHITNLTLTVISKQDLDDGSLRLDKAKTSKIPAQKYSETNGVADLQSVKVKELIASPDSTFKVKIGNKVLTYLDKANAATVTEDGYYYCVADPAERGEDINRYPGGSNYVILEPTDMTGSVASNLLVGSTKVFFNITGDAINVKYLTATLGYTGETAFVYNEDDTVNLKESLEKLFDKNKTAVSKNINSAQILDKAGNVIDPSRVDISVQNDTGDSGTVTAVFSGKNTRGTTGSVTKKIKIAAKKISAKDAEMKFDFAEGVNRNDVPYTKTGAKPEIVVTYGTGKNAVVLTEGNDYTVSYKNNTKVGAAGKVSVKLKGNYSGSFNNVLQFIVGACELSPQNIDIESTDKVYKANAGKNYFKSVPVLYDNGKKLALKKDYVYASEPVYYYAEDYIVKDKDGNVLPESRLEGTVIEDTDVVPAGVLVGVKFVAKPADKSSYKMAGEEGATFSTTYRIGAANISQVTIKVKDQEYQNGKEIIPSLDDFVLTPKKGAPEITSKDIEIISITNNTGVGTATMMIRANGNYCSTKKVTFKIVKGTEVSNDKQ